MEKKTQIKLDWRQVLGSIAIGIGVISIVDTPVTAAPTSSTIKVAQVGIRSRINPPTPLNLRPRTHTPLPHNNYDHPDRSYRRYHRDYGNYHDRHHHHHNGYSDRYERHNTYRKRRSNRSKVIIIRPGNLRDYGSRNYIRVLGR